MSDESSSDRRDARHRAAMAKQKTRVDAAVAAATTARGVVVLLTGNGKGKTSSAFGMVMRALGYGQRVGVIQFIKGVQASGEEIYLRECCPEVVFHQMGTGFTWDTQDRQADRAAAQATWAHAEALLADARCDLVVLDELTYMLGFDYLDADRVIEAIVQRPPAQSVVVTGRGGGRRLREIADTVAEVRDVKHAFTAGITARRGVDY